MSDVSNDTAISTGSSIARTIANRFADYQNLADYGLALNGSTDDSTALTTYYSSIPSGGYRYDPSNIAYIPHGSAWNVPTATQPAGTSVLFRNMGRLHGPYNAPVNTIGDGNVTENFNSGALSYSKSITNTHGGNAGTTFNVRLYKNAGTTNYGGDSQGVIWGETTVEPGSTGFSTAVRASAYQYGNLGTGNQDNALGAVSYVGAHADGCVWNHYSYLNDWSGLPRYTTTTAGEHSISGVGLEYANSSNVSGGSRGFGQYYANAYSFPNWSANTYYGSQQGNFSNGQNYVIAVAGYTYITANPGTTGSTLPTFPTSLTILSVSSVTYSGNIATLTFSGTPFSALPVGGMIKFSTESFIPSGYNKQYQTGIATIASSSSCTYPLSN